MGPRRWRWERLANMSSDIGTAPNFALDFAKTRFGPFCKVVLDCEGKFFHSGDMYECGLYCNKDNSHYYECIDWKNDCIVYVGMIQVNFDYNDIEYTITFNIRNTGLLSPGDGTVQIKMRHVYEDKDDDYVLTSLKYFEPNNFDPKYLV